MMGRSLFIDIIKSLAIFLVVLGHAPFCQGIMKQTIYSFHMPLFFAIYGFTYNIDNHLKRGFLTKEFAIKKMNRLLVPAIVWSIGYTLVNGLIDGTLNWKNLLFDFYGNQKTYNDANSLSSIWFLPVMFLSVCFTEFLMGMIYKLRCSNDKRCLLIAIVTIILPVITVVFPKLKYGYPMGLNLVPICTFFIILGGAFSKMNVISHIEKYKVIQSLTASLLLFIILVYLVKLNILNISIHNVDMASATWGNPILYIFTAIVGIMMMLMTSSLLLKISKFTWWAFIGVNTMGIFLIHKPIVVLLCGISVRYGCSSWILSIPYSIMALLLCIPFLLIINKKLPFVIGN